MRCEIPCAMAHVYTYHAIRFTIVLDLSATNNPGLQLETGVDDFSWLNLRLTKR